jgi:hypothetical protein
MVDIAVGQLEKIAREISKYFGGACPGAICGDNSGVTLSPSAPPQYSGVTTIDFLIQGSPTYREITYYPSQSVKGLVLYDISEPMSKVPPIFFAGDDETATSTRTSRQPGKVPAPSVCFSAGFLINC